MVLVGEARKLEAGITHEKVIGKFICRSRCGLAEARDSDGRIGETTTKAVRPRIPELRPIRRGDLNSMSPSDA